MIWILALISVYLALFSSCRCKAEAVVLIPEKERSREVAVDFLLYSVKHFSAYCLMPCFFFSLSYYFLPGFCVPWVLWHTLQILFPYCIICPVFPVPFLPSQYKLYLDSQPFKAVYPLFKNISLIIDWLIFTYASSVFWHWSVFLSYSW